jgi:hypothetical protein
MVVYQRSVLHQVALHRQEQFAALVCSLGTTWLSAEAPGVVPGTAAPAVDDQMCVLARDGQPVAFADSHGTWLSWLGRSHGKMRPGRVVTIAVMTFVHDVHAVALHTAPDRAGPHGRLGLRCPRGRPPR